MARIYLSSTYDDLRDHRTAVYQALRALRHDVVAMEDYLAADDRPVDRCLADVASCEIYVGVFALRYGHVPAKGNPERRSVTEQEYRKAGELGLPRLVFLTDDQCSWPLSMVDGM